MFVTGVSGYDDANEPVDIHEYTLSTAWDITSTVTYVGSFSIKSQEDYPTSLAFSSDGSKLFVLGREDDEINEYTLSCYYGVVNCMDPTSDKDGVASVSYTHLRAHET